MKKTVCKMHVTLLLCAIVGLSFLLLLFAQAPQTKAAALGTVAYDYLKVDKSLTNMYGNYDAFWEIRLYPQNGNKIYRVKGESNVIYQSATVDFLPIVKLVEVETKYGETDGNNTRAAIAKMCHWSSKDHNYANKMTVSGGAEPQVLAPCFGKAEAKRFNYGLDHADLHVITNQEKVLVNADYFTNGGSYALQFHATSIPLNENSHWYNEYMVTLNVTYEFFIRLDDVLTVGLEFSENDGTLYKKIGDTTYLLNTAGSSAEICKMTNLTDALAGTRFVVDGSAVFSERLTVNHFKENNKQILVYLATWFGSRAYDFHVVKDSVRPYITDAGAKELAAAFNNPALDGQLRRTEDTSKNKTVALGLTNTSIAFPYAVSDGESPISGAYTLKPLIMLPNGEVKLGEAKEENYSGGTLSEEGVYALTLTDLAGNTTTYEFVIKKSAPQFNSRKIANDSFISPYYYEVKLPSGYTNIALSGSAKYGTNLYNGTFSNTAVYLCETESNALKLAFDLEVQHVAIKTAKGYNYKLISNPKNTFEYVDLAEFEKAVTYFSARFVTQYTGFKEGANPYLDTSKTVVMDENLRKNSEKNTPLRYANKPAFFIYKDFVFAKNSIVTEQTNGVTNFVYGSKYLQITDLKTGLSLTDSGGFVKSDKFHGPTFTSLVGANAGFFRVQEWDGANNMTEYVVYFDLVPPTITVEYSQVGSEEKTERSITSKDTVSLYLNTFDIRAITDGADPYAMVKIDSATNPEISGIYATHFPLLSGNESGNGAGKYTFTVYDRSGNKFGFEVHLFGRPPSVKYSAYGSDEARKLTARVSKGESYNAVMDLKIFRNGEQLPTTYYEYDGADPIIIGNQNLEYVFTKGGIYFFELTDNFGRVTKTTEFKFTKNMPEVLLSGVSENGKTRQDVTVSLPIDCKFLLQFNGVYSDIGAVKDETKGLQYIFIKASELSSGHYYVKAWRETDPQNYNESRFEIKRIAPTVQLKTKGGEEMASGAVTNDNVYLAWDLRENIQSVTYVYNGRTTERYTKGEELTRSGKYEFKVKDELGNLTELTVIIDKLVSYEIIANGGGGRLSLSSESVDGVQVQVAKDSFSFVAKEASLTISMLKDGFTAAFTFEQTVTESGRYTVILRDEYGNEAKHVIDIDKIPPKAELIGVANNGSTRGQVRVKVSDPSDIAEVKLYVNNKLTDADILGTYNFTQHGSYRFELFDRAGNVTQFVFNIDTVVAYEANIVSGAMTNERVKIALKEDGTVSALKNGQKVENKDGYFSEVGKYSVTVQDKLGNTETLVFEINHAILTDSFSYNMPAGYIVYSVKNFGKPYMGYSLSQDSVIFTQDGEFEIVITDVATKKARIRYVFTIDRVPPTLTIEGVTNGGVTKSNILLSNVSKPDVTLTLFLDGKEIATGRTMKLTKNGSYRLVLTDRAGNKTEYTFTKAYSFNAFSVILIVLACLTVLGVAALILKIRLRVKVK